MTQDLRGELDIQIAGKPEDTRPGEIANSPIGRPSVSRPDKKFVGSSCKERLTGKREIGNFVTQW